MRFRNSSFRQLFFGLLAASFSIAALSHADKNSIGASSQSIRSYDSEYSSKSASQIDDGPYVFFRDGKILVKSIMRKGNSLFLQAENYSKKTDVTLTCYVAETKDGFTLTLNNKLQVPADEYILPEKMFVISDIEGNFAGLKMILLSAGVIDKTLHWSFGKGHFVFNGDLFDRGGQVTECLWFIYKLESEAEAAGGKVHFILGNHEIMNLHGNTKYVQQKYLDNAVILKEQYSDLFSNDTEIGKWLRTKNAVEKIGEYLFTHAGISPELALSNLRIEQINEIVRKNIGIKSRNYVADIDKLVNGSSGVFWYRGLVENKVTENEIDNILQFTKSSKIIVGHTIVNDIAALYGGKVIAIDLEHQRNVDEGFMGALVIESGKFFCVDDKGNKQLLKGTK